MQLVCSRGVLDARASRMLCALFPVVRAGYLNTSGLFFFNAAAGGSYVVNFRSEFVESRSLLFVVESPVAHLNISAKPQVHSHSRKRAQTTARFRIAQLAYAGERLTEQLNITLWHSDGTPANEGSYRVWCQGFSTCVLRYRACT